MMLGWSVMDPTIWSDVFLTDGQTELQSECSSECRYAEYVCRVQTEQGRDAGVYSMSTLYSVLCRVGNRSGTVDHGQGLSSRAYGSESNSAYTPALIIYYYLLLVLLVDGRYPPRQGVVTLIRYR